MKGSIRINIVLTCILLFLFVNLQGIKAQETGKMELLSPYFTFEETAANGFLDSRNFNGDFVANMENNEGFTVKFIADFKKFEQEQKILEIPEILEVHLRYVNSDDRNRQNYPAYKMQDGTVPVLEANVILLNTISGKLSKAEMSIGFPLAMISKPEGEHEVILNFTGPRWSMYVDGELVDNDFPIGYPEWQTQNIWSINNEFVKEAEIFFSAFKAKRDSTKKDNKMPDVQYWTPRGHNSWVGDVATFFYKGRYHVFYLFDRRHHSSKLGVGGHYFEHFSTADFETWTEHEAATPIEEQWETFGTGTPFIYNDQLCISYGLHTSRIYPDEVTMRPVLVDYFNKNGKTGFFEYDFTKGVPSGATYSISEDGLSCFKKTNKIFHYCENPSVYISPEGKLRMLANYHSSGMWGADNIDGDWYCINPDFPPGGDCTFFFRWGNFDYIIGGFVNLWSKPVGTSGVAWESMTAKGLDFYNGMNVPAITEIPGDRFLMAGWLKMRGWGGPFVIHEMIRYSDGRIGTKWMDELIPKVDKASTIAEKISQESTFPVEEESFMLTFDVTPKQGTDGMFGISFLPQDGIKDGCEFQIRIDDLVAQYAYAVQNNFAASEKSLRYGGKPHENNNYAIENLIGIDKPFTVRIIVESNSKFGGSVIDAEIAGQRTMITYRPDLTVKNLKFYAKGIEFKNVKISEVINDSNLTTSSLDIRESTNQLKVFPNPFVDQILIQLNSVHDEFVKVELIQMNGVKVLSKNYKCISGQNKLSINTNEISQGIYLLGISNNQKNFSQIVVKVS